MKSLKKWYLSAFVVPAVITLLSDLSLTEQRHWSIFQVSVLINHCINRLSEWSNLWSTGADVWRHQGFFGKKQCPDIRNLFHFIYVKSQRIWMRSEWTVMQGRWFHSQGCDYRGKQREDREIRENVLGWGCDSHLFLLTGGRRREVCSVLWYIVVLSVWMCWLMLKKTEVAGLQRNVKACSLFSSQVLVLLYASAHAWLHMISWPQ